MKKRPLILVTNDDGITAPGLRTLVKVMNKIGEVVVVAPDSPQSGMGHAITVDDTLYCKKEKIDNGAQTEYSTSGTPADCVKLAVNEILERKPDLCVSGINHGSNKRENPNGKKYYWLTGEHINLDKGKDTDQSALKSGYISIVPIMYDMTSYSEIDEINKWNLNG